MRNEKGLTLVTVIIYCTIMVLVIGIVSVIQMTTNNNLETIQSLKGYIPEINKLSMYMLAETKDAENGVKKLAGDGSSIEFKNGDKYIFSDNSVYKIFSNNRKVKVCEDLINCVFEYDMQNRKEILKVTLQMGTDEIVTKTMEYVFI